MTTTQEQRTHDRLVLDALRALVARIDGPGHASLLARLDTAIGALADPPDEKFGLGNLAKPE